MADQQPIPEAGQAVEQGRDLLSAARFAVIAAGSSACLGYAWFDKPFDLVALAVQFAVFFGGWYMILRARSLTPDRKTNAK